MGEKTEISWCDSTFNPWIGCTKVSPGCENCYAENMARRFWPDVKWGANLRKRTSDANWKLPLRWNRSAKAKFAAWETFKMACSGLLTDEQLMEQGFHKPRRPRVFCGAMCDWLDDSIPLDWLDDLITLIDETPYLNWLLLTKRPENWKTRIHRVAKELGNPCAANWSEGTPPFHVHFGTTVCNQAEVDREIPKLLSIPAEKRFLSIEPMFGAIDLYDCLFKTYGSTNLGRGGAGRMTLTDAPLKIIDWVIVGGETGAKARPMNHDWVQSIRDQCADAGVPFFFKGWGKYAPCDETEWRDWNTAKHKNKNHFYKMDSLGNFERVNQSECPHDDSYSMQLIHKRDFDYRLLDGREHSEFPA